MELWGLVLGNNSGPDSLSTNDFCNIDKITCLANNFAHFSVYVAGISMYVRTDLLSPFSGCMVQSPDSARKCFLWPLTHAPFRGFPVCWCYSSAAVNISGYNGQRRIHIMYFDTSAKLF